MHLAISDRVFGLTGTARTPIRFTHDAIAKASYGSTRAIGSGIGSLAVKAIGAAGRVSPEGPLPISRTGPGAFAVGALNGWAGDRLDRDGNPLAARMSVRHLGETVEPTTEALAASYPNAGPRIAIFLHGLMETEHTWWIGTKRKDGTHRPNFGERFEADFGYSPVYFRYNSGLHVSENGALLSALLEEIVGEWPVEVEEIATFGFSMGGLIARSAGCHGIRDQLTWPDLVRHTFHIGSPNHGSPLERFANAGTWLLTRLRETEPIGRTLNERSVGVKDMRYGNVMQADWLGHEPDELLRDHRVPPVYLPNSTHYFLSATLTRDPSRLLSRVVGDLLVTLPSAWAEDANPSRTRFDIERSRNFGGMTHFHLVSHEAVYEQIAEWLQRPALPAEAEAAGLA